MSKKEKLVWIVSGIVAVILIVAVIWMFAFNGDSETEGDSAYSADQEEMNQDHDNQVLEAQENVVFDADLVGTWLTAVAEPGSEELSYEGFVLRPDGTALVINSDEDYSNWRVEDYRLFFSLEEGEVEEISYIIDYIGKDGLILRSGDTTIRYTLEAK
jgi:hypothetical protein